MSRTAMRHIFDRTGVSLRPELPFPPVPSSPEKVVGDQLAPQFIVAGQFPASAQPHRSGA